jgi:hypothetical protein
MVERVTIANGSRAKERTGHSYTSVQGVALYSCHATV